MNNLEANATLPLTFPRREECGGCPRGAIQLARAVSGHDSKAACLANQALVV